MIVALCEHNMLLRNIQECTSCLKDGIQLIYSIAGTDRWWRLVTAEEEVRNGIHSERLQGRNC